MLAECLFNNLVVGERDTLLVGLAVAAFVDQLADGLEVGLAVLIRCLVSTLEYDIKRDYTYPYVT